MNEIRISWNSAPGGESGIQDTLILESEFNQSVHNTVFIRNNSNKTAVNAGFYIEPAPHLHINNDFNSNGYEKFEHLMRWAETDYNDLPYGFFTVFGKDSNEVSYIDKYFNYLNSDPDPITESEMLSFQHAWNQGISGLNKIEYGNIEGEEEIKVLNIVRIPPGTDLISIDIYLKINYLELL